MPVRVIPVPVEPQLKVPSASEVSIWPSVPLPVTESLSAVTALFKILLVVTELLVKSAAPMSPDFISSNANLLLQ